MVSRVLGFIRTAVLAAVIGTVASESADAFAIASQLPNNIFWLISSGVFSAILIPELVRSRRDPDGGAAHLNRLLTLGLIIMALATVAALFLAPALVHLYVSEWSPARINLAVAFALWCFPQIFFYGVFSLCGETLNSRGHFAPAAWAPLVNSVISLATLGVFAWAFGVFPQATAAVEGWTPGMIALLAGGSSLGVAGQAAVVALAMYRAGIRFSPNFRWRGASLGTATRAAKWTFGLVIIGQVLGVVQTNIVGAASGQNASASALITAWLVFMLPYSVIAVSIGTLYFTRLSRHAQAGRTGDLAAELAWPVRVLAVAMLGAFTVMMIVALPLSRFFTNTAENAQALALVLMAFLVSLLPLSFLFLFQRAFYALGDARTPFVYTCVQAAALLTGTLLLPGLVELAYLTAAVAAVQSLAATVQVLIAAWLLRRRVGPMGVRRALPSIGRALIAMLASAAIALPLGSLLGDWGMSERAEALLLSAVLAAVCGGTFVLGMVLLRDPVPRRLFAEFFPARPAAGR
ncbi:murein biosynthesis integral membrane protein MurJ [Mycetocola spongiae]|uniref:murein biosynthesis integral membrane protein MurJ n=1 Tax=Mycetocola spongiae TaxID=2859226 RepID=UPI001CF4FEAE|nr:lipid II flippase MurJ [Mycetocola spongiae]UCR89958.1 virulence factor MviN [Mycetocola spongiae]